MKCFIGLGNPGKKYKSTRHNVGFMVLDELLHRHQWTLKKEKYNGFYTIEHFRGEKIIVLKPQTFMNRSGESIKPLLEYYKINIEEILVIYDDLDLPVGKIRLRQKGGHGGHNGIRSTIDQLGTNQFKRLRIGIGRPTDRTPIVDYVLSPFSKDQQEDVTYSIKRAADACERWTVDDFTTIMNTFNQ